MSIDQNLRYTAEHEWLAVAGEEATVGITPYAADALGDVVFVQLPEAGDRIEAGHACGEIESTKSVSDLYAPATGEVIAVNAAVVDDPSLVNRDPYGEGWLFRLRVTEPPKLLSADEYAALIGAGS